MGRVQELLDQAIKAEDAGQVEQADTLVAEATKELFDDAFYQALAIDNFIGG